MGFERRSTEDAGLIFWSATLGLDRPFRDCIDAARSGGCRRVSISPGVVVRAEAEGTSRSHLRQLLRDEGLELVLEPVMGWHDDTSPVGGDGVPTVSDVVAMAEDLPVAAVIAVGPFDPAEVPAAGLSARFATLCDRAADVGIGVGLEFMPFSVVPDVKTAWRIVDDADRVNGGIVFDTWHFFRGIPDFETLGELPGDRIIGVQVSDGPAEPAGSLVEDTFHRLLPGDGSFDLLAALRALEGIGGLRWVGPEVLSPVMAAMPHAEAASLACDRVRELVTQARA